MAYTDLDTIHTPTAGAAVPATWGAQVNANFDHYYDNFGSKLGAWTSYTPTISGTGSALGNGTLRGYYRREGTLLWLRVRWTLGSTSTVGGAGTSFALPSGMVAVTETDQFQTIPGVLRDTGTAEYFGLFRATTGATALTAYAIGAGGTYATIAAVLTTVPHTWANTDVMAFTGAIEIAP